MCVYIYIFIYLFIYLFIPTILSLKWLPHAPLVHPSGSCNSSGDNFSSSWSRVDKTQGLGSLQPNLTLQRSLSLSLSLTIYKYVYNKYIYIYMCVYTHTKYLFRQIDRLIDRQIDRQTDRQIIDWMACIHQTHAAHGLTP